ncbi:MAG: TIGR02757 family protein [Treponema sp.]|jgi:uncharacterized protein (TIGR02757 family)|nr:TIGR02757 family protein [Treponema sp.]
MPLKQELDQWYEKICNTSFIAPDPVQFPRRYTKREDIEIAAFLSATIAWGRRDIILRSAEKMFGLMEKSPFAFVQNGGYKKLKNNNIHRTFFEDDLKYFCSGFKRCYVKYGNMEKLFASALSDNPQATGHNIWAGIALFREEMAAANNGNYSKHIADPGIETGGGSACKRINLALRWLVRKGPVDLGIWKSIKPAALYIPLDVHVARTARKLGLLERKSNDKKAVIALTEKLREFCPADPVKYDFALFAYR